MTNSTQNLPRVSVCLLTYNRARVLPRTIESLLNQTHGNFELIINDDRSPDDTERICLEYAKRDSRIRYVKNRKNLRYAGNQNAALIRAATDYVAIVHDGDVYRTDLIERWTRALVEQPTAALVFNAVETMDSTGHVVRTFRHPYGPIVKGVDLFDEMIRMPHSPIFGIVMVRKSCLQAVGPFDPRLPVLGDVDMWLRLLLRYDGAYIPEALLAVSPRELGHHNNSANWDIRREYETIYLLNTARRYPDDPIKVATLRRQIAPMIWRIRLRSFLYCVRHANIKGAVIGLKFMFCRWSFSSIYVPDKVYTWNEAIQTIGVEPEVRTFNALL